MRIDRERVLQIVTGAAPLFEDRAMAEHLRTKGRADYVTAVDMAVQKQIGGALRGAWPDVQFMGEEQDNRGIDFSGDVWILDPVDGTTNLIHDYRQSAVSLGYLEDGVLTFGAIFQPFSGELFWAERGKGAYCNGKRIHVSGAAGLRGSIAAVGTSPYRKDLAEKNFALFRAVFREADDLRRSGSAACDLAWTAAGRVDVYAERDLKPWDMAAGILLVREAGGTVLTLQGNEPDVTKNQDIAAGSAGIVREIVALAGSTSDGEDSV